MIRMSSLPIAQYCGLAPKLYAEHGAGRAAAMSTAFHALCAGNESPMLSLTAAEREELSEWKKPADVIVDGTPLPLHYDDANLELEVALSHGGYPCQASSAMVVGHLDMGWIRPMGGNRTIAFVGDIKKSRWTTVDGPETLQLHAYGLAYAQEAECDGWTTGIWLPIDGEWIWSERVIMLGSEEHAEIWAKILWACDSEDLARQSASTGPHCDNCYARLHCPEFTLPAVLSTTELGPVAAGMVPSPEQAAKMLRWISALDGDNGLLAKAKGQLKQWVGRGELVVEDGDKVWGAVQMPGRKSLNRKKLEASVGDLSAFETVGAPYDQFRWLKRKP